MSKNKAIVYLIIFTILFLFVPLFVICYSLNLKGGWHELLWGSTEDQVNEWVSKHNMNYSFSKCPESHFGVTCKKLFWKKGEVQDNEMIEFQFQDNKLVCVIETGKIIESDSVGNLNFGKPLYGTDVNFYTKKEKGVTYEYVDRAFFYKPSGYQNGSNIRIVVNRLIQNVPGNLEFEDKVVSYRITKMNFSPDYYRKIKDSRENFKPKDFFQ